MKWDLTLTLTRGHDLGTWWRGEDSTGEGGWICSGEGRWGNEEWTFVLGDKIRLMQEKDLSQWGTECHAGCWRRAGKCRMHYFWMLCLARSKQIG